MTDQVSIATESTSAATPRNRRRLIVLAAVMVACAAGAALWAFVLRGSSHTFTAVGTVSIGGSSIGGSPNWVAIPSTDVNSECAGAGGYSDLAKGAAVTVTDASGKVIALGSVTSSAEWSGACVLGFSVSGVPSGQKFYGVEVTHRGVLRYTEAQMRDGVTATIGS